MKSLAVAGKVVNLNGLNFNVAEDWHKGSASFDFAVTGIAF